MVKRTIQLSSVSDVKDFVHIVTKYDFDIDMISGKYKVDAKSIMGIFSLNLAKPIELEIHSEECQPLLDDLARFII